MHDPSWPIRAVARTGEDEALLDVSTQRESSTAVLVKNERLPEVVESYASGRGEFVSYVLSRLPTRQRRTEKHAPTAARMSAGIAYS
jgi:hypothetical protein